jgi:hypothetical protein
MAENELAVDEQADNDDVEQLLAALAVIWAGMTITHLEKTRVRNPSRLYLTRPQLLPNPRFDTPWQRLHASQSDRAFITTMGFDVPTFDSIIAARFGQLWYEMPIPRPDSNENGRPRPGGRSLDAEGALGLVLHYLNSTMREISLQEIFCIGSSNGVALHYVQSQTASQSLTRHA